MGDGLKGRAWDMAFTLARLPLSLAPRWAEAIALGVFVETALERDPELKRKLEPIDGRLFFFEAVDIKKGFYLKIEGGRARVLLHCAKKPDVTMRGEAKILAGVLAGREDPDTVFFSRRLEINGDTAAALHLKNLLNSL